MNKTNRPDVVTPTGARRRVASYAAAVQWIAYNDDEDLGCADTGYVISICLVADLWREGDQVQVAADVMKVRKGRK